MVVRRISICGDDSFIQTSQTFKNHLGPRLVNGTFGRLGLATKLKFRIGKSQCVVDGIDPSQHADPRINYRPGLQIKISRTLGIEDLELSGLALVAEKLD